MGSASAGFGEYPALTALEQAETVDEAVSIAQNAGNSAQNFIVRGQRGEDRLDHRGTHSRASRGIRSNASCGLESSGIGWQGWLMPAQYPLYRSSIRNAYGAPTPAVVDGLMLDRLGDGGYDLSARAKQIRDGLYERELLHPGCHAGTSARRSRAVPESVARTSRPDPEPRRSSALHTEMQQGLRDWDGRASTASVSYRLVRAFRQEVIQRALEGFEAAVRQRDPPLRCRI